MPTVNWALGAFILLAFAIGGMYLHFERKGSDAKEVALVATMASLAGITRIPFAAIMSFQPTTFIVMISGYVFGSHLGFIIGATAALISNFFLGQGPWTPWQMCAWGLCGIIGGLMGRNRQQIKVVPFAVVSFLCGYLFGWLMNIWHWLGFVYPLTTKTFLATYIASFPFDTVHAAGNALFSMLFARSFFMILVRFRKRLYVIEEKDVR